jgi:hypothetical protein
MKKKNQMMVNSADESSDSTSNITHYMYKNGNKFDSKSQIMIKLSDSSQDKIDYIEDKYNLRLIRKLNSGDYLFENLGDDTLHTMEELLNDNQIQIKRINPNMQLNMNSL